MMLEYKKREQTGWITLTNPPYNALIDPVFAQKAELESFLEDSDLKAVIIQGKGRHFSSGADIEALRAGLADPAFLCHALDQGKELLKIISLATIPVFALIRGSCLGAGLEIALACHFRFAARSAMFGFPEAEHRLLPGFGGTVLAGGLINRGVLIDLILSGRMIRAEEAHAIGLVDEVGASGRIEAQLLEYIRQLTEKRSAVQIRAVMQSIRNGRQMPVSEALAAETVLFCQLARDLDARTISSSGQP